MGSETPTLAGDNRLDLRNATPADLRTGDLSPRAFAFAAVEEFLDYSTGDAADPSARHNLSWFSNLTCKD